MLEDAPTPDNISLAKNILIVTSEITKSRVDDMVITKVIKPFPNCKELRALSSAKLSFSQVTRTQAHQSKTMDFKCKCTDNKTYKYTFNKFRCQYFKTNKVKYSPDNFTEFVISRVDP